MKVTEGREGTGSIVTGAVVAAAQSAHTPVTPQPAAAAVVKASLHLFT